MIFRNRLTSRDGQEEVEVEVLGREPDREPRLLVVLDGVVMQVDLATARHALRRVARFEPAGADGYWSL